MIAETPSAVAQPDPAGSPAAVAHPGRHHQRSEHASRALVHARGPGLSRRAMTWRSFTW
jgi:hypothetical protein